MVDQPVGRCSQNEFLRLFGYKGKELWRILELATIERSAAKSMKHEDTSLVNEHQRMSLNEEPEMTQWDGVITHALNDQHPSVHILKEKDASTDQYYLFYARQPGAFQVVHSLNHSISNPKYFDSATFPKIIQALTGVKTQLRLKW